MSALASMNSVKESSSLVILAAITSTPAEHTHHTTTAPAYFYNAAFAGKWNKYTGSGSWSTIG